MRFLTALSGSLVIWSFVGNYGFADELYVPRNLAAAAVLLLVARRTRLDAADLALEPRRLPAGLRLGAGSAAAIAGVVLAAAALADRFAPLATVLDDDRAALGAAGLTTAILVRIPLGTALFEEVAFRGVLRAACRRVAGPVVATLWSSFVFGLWHIPPTAIALRINDVEPLSPTGLGAIALGAVSTALAGVLLDLLRARSGSLAAPVLAHWAANASGLAAAVTAR